MAIDINDKTLNISELDHSSIDDVIAWLKQKKLDGETTLRIDYGWPDDPSVSIETY